MSFPTCSRLQFSNTRNIREIWKMKKERSLFCEWSYHQTFMQVWDSQSLLVVYLEKPTLMLQNDRDDGSCLGDIWKLKSFFFLVVFLELCIVFGCKVSFPLLTEFIWSSEPKRAPQQFLPSIQGYVPTGSWYPSDKTVIKRRKDLQHI